MKTPTGQFTSTNEPWWCDSTNGDHNPFLVAAGFDTTDIRIPWLGNRRLQFQFG